MRNDYKLIFTIKDEGCFEVRFKCTRTQIDKAFNSLAFAACGSSLDSCVLYQCGKTPRGVSIFNTDIELNRFVVKSIEVG